MGGTIPWWRDPGLCWREKPVEHLVCVLSLFWLWPWCDHMTSCFKLLLPWLLSHNRAYLELWARINSSSLTLLLLGHFVIATGEEKKTSSHYYLLIWRVKFFHQKLFFFFFNLCAYAWLWVMHNVWQCSRESGCSDPIKLELQVVVKDGPLERTAGMLKCRATSPAHPLCYCVQSKHAAFGKPHTIRITFDRF